MDGLANPGSKERGGQRTALKSRVTRTRQALTRLSRAGIGRRAVHRDRSACNQRPNPGADLGGSTRLAPAKN